MTNKHLIFVKNLPGYMADTITEIFEQYHPISIKNVYPRSDTTTIVVSFPTKQEADRAQSETDQMRLNNVILNVEKYNKTQSVRFLRGKHWDNLLLDAKENGHEEDIEEDSVDGHAMSRTPTPLEPQFAPVAPAASPVLVTEGITWASVAAKLRSPKKRSFLQAPNLPAEDTVTATPTSAPCIPVAIPVNTPAVKPENTDHVQTTAISLNRKPSSEATVLAQMLAWRIDTPSEPDVEYNSMKRRAMDKSVWEARVAQQHEDYDTKSYIDTTARIRQMHCRDCVFCKKRMRLE
jgi:hypothetical protein